MSDLTDPHTPVAIILAAGAGRRMSADQPKQLSLLYGRPVFVHAVEPYVAHGHHVILVAGADIRSTLEAQLELHLSGAVVDIVTGGETRRESFLAGATRIPSATASGTGVIVQNAVSPNTPYELVEQCLAKLADFAAAQAYHPNQLTTIAHRNGVLDRVVPRGDLAFIADPSVYRRDLVDAIADEMRGANGPVSHVRDVEQSTTIDIAQRLGAQVAMVESSPSNLKITASGDLNRLEYAMALTSR